MFKKILCKVLILTMLCTLFSGLSSKEVVNADVAGGLIANWKFDGNTMEAVKGIATINETNIKYENGILGKAAVFNGKDSYMETAFDKALLLGSNFTISFWAYNEDNAAKTETYLQMGRDCGWNCPGRETEYFTSPYKLFLNEASTASVKLSNAYMNDTTSNEGDANYADKSIDAEEWFLYTVTYDGNTIKLYHDNILLGQQNYEYGTNVNPYGLLVGADDYFEYYFKGKMDDLRLYNRALSYDDVKSLYTFGLSQSKELLEPSNKLVVGYSFDGDTKDSSIYKNDAKKVEVSGTIKYAIGKNDKAILLTKGNYIEIPSIDQLNFDNELTISYWLRVDKEGSYPVLYRQNPAMGTDSPNESSYRIDVEQWGGTSINSTFIAGLYSPEYWSGADASRVSSSNEKNGKLGTWHHYTYTIEYNENNDQIILKSYLDGNLQNKSDASDYVNVLNASGSLLIGFDNSTFITAAMDELQIYNYARSATQIKEESQRIDGISLSASYSNSLKSLKVGKTLKVSNIMFSNITAGTTISINSSDKNVTFKSSNAKVFTVDNSGNILGKKKGSATLTVTYGGNTKSYKVTVK